MGKSKHINWFIFTVSKRLFVCYVSQTYLANIFCTFKDPSNTSLVRYECLKDYRTLCMSQKDSFVRYECLRDVFFTLRMSQRQLFYVKDVPKTSFVRYVCLKDIFCTLQIS